MYKYILLWRDDERKIQYYYNFIDSSVYWIDVRESTKRSENAAKNGGFLGGMAALFLCSTIGDKNYNLPFFAIMLISFIVGVFAAIIAGRYIVKSTYRMFIPQNRLIMPDNAINDLYYRGTGLYTKIICIEIFLLVLALLGGFMTSISQDGFLLLCTVCIWFGWGLCLWARRPICTREFKKMMQRRRYMR